MGQRQAVERRIGRQRREHGRGRGRDEFTELGVFTAREHMGKGCRAFLLFHHKGDAAAGAYRIVLAHQSVELGRERQRRRVHRREVVRAQALFLRIGALGGRGQERLVNRDRVGPGFVGDNLF